MIDWKDEIVAILHKNKITRIELAEELGVTNVYVTMVLNSTTKEPKNAEERFRNAVDRILENRSCKK